MIATHPQPYCLSDCGCAGGQMAYRCAFLPGCLLCAEPCGEIVEGDATEDGWSPVRCGKPSVTNGEPWRCAEHQEPDHD